MSDRTADVEALIARHWQPWVDAAEAADSPPDIRSFTLNRDWARKKLTEVMPEMPAGLPGRLIALAYVTADAEMGAGYSWIWEMLESLEREARGEAWKEKEYSCMKCRGTGRVPDRSMLTRYKPCSCELGADTCVTCGSRRGTLTGKCFRCGAEKEQR